MSCDKKVPRQALGGELGLAGNFPPHATVITKALQSLAVPFRYMRPSFEAKAKNGKNSGVALDKARFLT